MTEKSFMTVEEVAAELRVSKSKAYQIVRELNTELQKQGYLTVTGRVNATFFHQLIEWRERQKKKGVVEKWKTCYNRDTESQRAKAAYPPSTEGLTLRTRERRDAHVCYISGPYPDRYLHGCPYRIVLYDLQGQKIAANYSQ